MYAIERLAPPSRAPRIVVAGEYVDALGRRDDGLAAELAAVTNACRVRARSAVSVYRQAARAVGRDGFEGVHLLDARLAPIGLMLRRRFGVPVTVTINPGRVVGGGPQARVTRAALRRLDQGFVTDHGTVRYLQAKVRSLPVVLTEPAAATLAEPEQRALTAMSRRLRGLVPGRLVIGVPWTADDDYMRWHRDAVAPLLTGNPVCLILGAPSRRRARVMFGAHGGSEYRIHTGRLDGDVLTGAARCVDVFVSAGAPLQAHMEPDLHMTMAASGVPLVVGGGVRASFLRHEENAFIAVAGDPLSLVSTLNQLLALPAIQRHYLGEQFGQYTLERQTWRDAASVYAERFAVLVGRPQIPVNLRAA